jgi:nitroreductase
METEKAILGRRAVRAYDGKPVSEKIIAELLKAGAMAPSAMDEQPCRFIVISGRETIRRLSDRVKEKALALEGESLSKRMGSEEDVIF